MSTQKRFIPKEEALRILEQGSFGVLSTQSPDGRPYGVPVHYCFSQSENCIFFHCANEGRKLDNISANPWVSFVVAGHFEVIPEKITTRYESAIIEGEAKIVRNPSEKTEKLRALCIKYAPKTPYAADDTFLQNCGDTTIIKIQIANISGKRNKG